MPNEQPYNVKLFEGLMYYSIAVGFVLPTIYRPQPPAQVANSVQRLAFVVGAVGAIVVIAVARAVFVWLAARRHRSWARWTLLIYFSLFSTGILIDVFGSADFLARLEQTLPRQRTVARFLFSSAGRSAFIAEVLALYVIFTGDARDWFRESTRAVASP